MRIRVAAVACVVPVLIAVFAAQKAPMANAEPGLLNAIEDIGNVAKSAGASAGTFIKSASTMAMLTRTIVGTIIFGGAGYGVGVLLNDLNAKDPSYVKSLSNDEGSNNVSALPTTVHTVKNATSEILDDKAIYLFLNTLEIFGIAQRAHAANIQRLLVTEVQLGQAKAKEKAEKKEKKDEKKNDS